MVAEHMARGCEQRHKIPSRRRAHHYGCNAPAIIAAMEADKINLIENSLQDLAARSAEIRRYL